MQGNEEKFAPYNASAYRVGIVCARFNSEVTEQILASAKKKLAEYKIAEDNVDVFFVPGSVELSVVLQALAKKKKYDCLVAIGAVIKGETDHYHHVANMASQGILRVMLDNVIPIGFAVLTTSNKELALARVAIGGEAVMAAMQTKREIEH